MCPRVLGSGRRSRRCQTPNPAAPAIARAADLVLAARPHLGLGLAGAREQLVAVGPSLGAQALGLGARALVQLLRLGHREVEDLAHARADRGMAAELEL